MKLLRLHFFVVVMVLALLTSLCLASKVLKYYLLIQADDAPPYVGSILCGLIISASYRG